MRRLPAAVSGATAGRGFLDGAFAPPSQGRQTPPEIGLIDAELAGDALHDLLLLNSRVAARLDAQPRRLRHDRKQPLDRLAHAQNVSLDVDAVGGHVVGVIESVDRLVGQELGKRLAPYLCK